MPQYFAIDTTTKKRLVRDGKFVVARQAFNFSYSPSTFEATTDHPFSDLPPLAIFTYDFDPPAGRGKYIINFAQKDYEDGTQLFAAVGNILMGPLWTEGVGHTKKWTVYVRANYINAPGFCLWAWQDDVPPMSPLVLPLIDGTPGTGSLTVSW